MKKVCKIGLLLLVLTLSATAFVSCVVKEYTVTLDYYTADDSYGRLYNRGLHGGLPPSEEIKVESGKSFSPSRPSNKNFLGWFKDSACTVPWVNGEDKVTCDITLYAKWG